MWNGGFNTVKSKTLIVMVAIVASCFSGTAFCDKGLKDFDSIFIECNFEGDARMGKKDIAKYEEEIIKKLQENRLIIKKNEDKADIKIICTFENVRPYFGWEVAGDVLLEFCSPDDDKALKILKLDFIEIGDTTNRTITSVADIVATKIREEYDSALPIQKTLPNGVHVGIDEYKKSQKKKGRTASWGKNKTFHDFKKVYVEYTAEPDRGKSSLDMSNIKKYKQCFQDKLKMIGFEIVDHEPDADLVAKCNVCRITPSIAGWDIVGKILVDFTMPETEEVILNFETNIGDWGGHTSYSKAEDILFKRITNAYKKELPEFGVNRDGDVINLTDIEKAKKWQKKALTYEDNMALKEFKNVFLELDIKYSETGFVASEAERQKIRDMIIKGINDTGFNIVGDITDADLKMVFHINDAILPFGLGWRTNKVIVELLLPWNDFFVNQYVVLFDDAKTNFMDKYFRMIFTLMAEDYDSGEVKYKIARKKELEQYNKYISETPKYADAYNTIFKEREPFSDIKDADFINIGLLILPVYGTSKAYKSFDAPPISKDVFKDINEYTCESKKHFFLVREITKEKMTEKGLGVYFREDFRDIIYNAFENALEPYRVNLHEIRYENYVDDLITAGLKEALIQIKEENKFNRVFVVYYYPIGSWTETEIRGNYKYWRHTGGLKLIIYGGYFDLGDKIKRIANFEDTVIDYDTLRVDVDYNKVLIRIEKTLQKFLKKHSKKSKFKEIAKENKFDSNAYVLGRETFVFDNNNIKIAKLRQRAKLSIKEADENTSVVRVKGYVKKENISRVNGNIITLSDNKNGVIITADVLYKNRYDNGSFGTRKVIGKFFEKSNIELTLPPTISKYSPEYYEVIFEGKVETNNLSDDLAFLKENGKVEGNIIKGGEPVKNLRLLLDGTYRNKKAKTTSDGDFVFKNVKSGDRYKLRIKNKETKKYDKFVKLKDKRIVINPGEKLNVGTYDIADENLYDFSMITDKLGKILPIVKKLKKRSKAEVIGYLGKPETMYTENIWRINYDDIDFTVSFNADGLYRFSYSAKFDPYKDEEDNEEDISD